MDGLANAPDDRRAHDNAGTSACQDCLEDRRSNEMRQNGRHVTRYVGRVHESMRNDCRNSNPHRHDGHARPTATAATRQRFAAAVARVLFARIVGVLVALGY